MFNNLEEGISHSSLPSNLKRVKRYNFGEGIFGNTPALIEKFLNKEESLKPLSKISLGKQIRNFIHQSSNRKKYIDLAVEYLQNKPVHHQQIYDAVLIGAGVHAALFVYTIKKENPDLKILVVEKSSSICSTFYKLGDALVLNSPTFSKAGLNSNIMQGHFVQASDFDELFEKPFPTAKHIYELTTMVFFHSDADIVFNFQVDEIKKSNRGYEVQFKDKSFEAHSVIVSNGMGDPNLTSFSRDRSSDRLITGDEFIANCFQNEPFLESIRDKRIAVVGNGDTANCVMEYLLPLVYPNYDYGFCREHEFLPQLIYWVGQCAKDVQEYYFDNKTRYCHSGGVIEFFWNGETPFELSAGIWRKTKDLIKCIPQKLSSLTHKEDSLELNLESITIDVDIVIDSTGRSNALRSSLMKNEKEYINGDIVLYGGHWSYEEESFIAAPIKKENRRIACRLKGEDIYLIGSVCLLEELVDDEEAKDGSAKFLEQRNSLTNSKRSLEHTLPRTVSFAQFFHASY